MTEENKQPVQPLSTILPILRKGHLDYELGEKLLEVKEAARRTGKRCTLVIHLHVETEPGEELQDNLTILDEHQIKQPKAPARMSLVFENPETGAIQKTDPQLTLTDALRDANEAPDEGEVRDINQPNIRDAATE